MTMPSLRRPSSTVVIRLEPGGNPSGRNFSTPGHSSRPSPDQKPPQEPTGYGVFRFRGFDPSLPPTPPRIPSAWFKPACAAKPVARRSEQRVVDQVLVLTAPHSNAVGTTRLIERPSTQTGSGCNSSAQIDLLCRPGISAQAASILTFGSDHER